MRSYKIFHETCKTQYILIMMNRGAGSRLNSRVRVVLCREATLSGYSWYNLPFIYEVSGTTQVLPQIDFGLVLVFRLRQCRRYQQSTPIDNDDTDTDTDTLILTLVLILILKPSSLRLTQTLTLTLTLTTTTTSILKQVQTLRRTTNTDIHTADTATASKSSPTPN